MWIDEQLTRVGRSRTGPIRQRKQWSISSVLQVPTDGGNVYFKALPPLFAHEPALIALLARHAQPHVPELLAAGDLRPPRDAGAWRLPSPERRRDRAGPAHL